MILQIGHVLLHSYREACSVLGYADTRLPEIRAYFSSHTEGRVALSVPVPSHAELIEIEGARRCLAQLHIVRLKRDGVGRVRELEGKIASLSWWMSEHGVEPLEFNPAAQSAL